MAVTQVLECVNGYENHAPTSLTEEHECHTLVCPGAAAAISSYHQRLEKGHEIQAIIIIITRCVPCVLCAWLKPTGVVYLHIFLLHPIIL